MDALTPTPPLNTPAGSKTRAAVLFGGRSGEHEVSLQSAQSVIAALPADKYAVTEVGITRQGAWFVGPGTLKTMLAGKAPGEQPGITPAAILPDPTCQGLYRLQPGQEFALLSQFDVVIPVLHGTFGEDGTLQGLLELADTAYVGAGVLGASLAMDKSAFKDVMKANQIPVLEHLLVLRSTLQNQAQDVVAAAEALAPYPLFTKPANLGSSVGISKCRSRADLYEGLLEAARFDRRVLVERGVAKAREIEVSILGNDNPQASVPGEIVPAGDFYSYESKYEDDRSLLLIPAPISAELAERVRSLAIQAYKAIDCAGLARVDFLLDDETGELYLNEINTMPGFTRISMYPKLWEASGLPYPALLDRLVELAFARKRERDETVREYKS